MRAAILAGGKAERFGGRPKGLERVGGRRILDRVVDRVVEATGELPLLVANAPDAGSWRLDLEVTADLVTGAGSLGGIYTALAHGGADVLVLGWDMPFLPVSLLRELIDRSAGFDAFLPASEGPRGVEPLCAVYRPACLDPIRSRLESRDYRAVGFHDAVRLGILPLPEVAGHGPPDRTFFNVNTAADLARAEDWCRKPG